MKKKFSHYNRFFATSGTTVHYNCASDGMLALLPELEEVILSSADKADELADIHPELFKALIAKRMIIDETEEEWLSVIDNWQKEDTDPSRFNITINPTMSCNLHCWYCYEKHNLQTTLSKELVNAIRKLIAQKVEDPQLKVLTLDFFGGEPLLDFQEHILPLLNYAQELCSLHQVKLLVSFTTNGVLLTPEVIAALQPFNTKKTMQIQITLDGNRDSHNAIRKTSANLPTYDLIIAHIKAAVSAGISISVRLNYTNKNAHTFVDVIKEFKEVKADDRNLLSFNFHKVWQDSQTDATEYVIEESRGWFSKEGFSVGSPNEYGRSRCYADKENCMVINYNGDLFKCTARDFKSEHREGTLQVEGQLHWNEAYHKRMEIKYGNECCRHCVIFPICHGGCSQDKLESSQPDGCIRHYDENKKEEILAGRLNYLLMNSHVNAK